jgi:hypothetical protein
MSSNNNADILGKRLIPKRLEEELNNVPKYNPSHAEQRRTSVGDAMDFNVERAMYEEFVTPALNKRGIIKISDSVSMKSHDRPVAAVDKQNTNAGTTSDDRVPVSEASSSSGATKSAADSNMTVKMLTRLADAEEEVRSLRRQLVDKMGIVDSLRHENALLKKFKDEAIDKNGSSSDGKNTELVDEVEFLKNENYDLQCQIADMEDFLRDYGLRWVGRPSSGSIFAGNPNRQHIVSYVQFKAKINELNELIKAEPAQVQVSQSNRRGRFVHLSEELEPIKLTFYKNGIMVKRGPFRTNGSDTYVSFVRDIMDGYFPSEFKKDYPDGVIFELIDKHECEYAESGWLRDGDADSIGAANNQGDVMSKHTLLSNLPKTVIRNGEIVNARDEIASRLAPNSPPRQSGGQQGDIVDKKEGDQNTHKLPLIKVSNSLSGSNGGSRLSGSSGASKSKHFDARQLGLAPPPIPNTGNAGVSTMQSRGSLTATAKVTSDTVTDGSAGNIVRPVEHSVTAKVRVRWVDSSILTLDMYAENTIADVRHFLIHQFKLLVEHTMSDEKASVRRGSMLSSSSQAGAAGTTTRTRIIRSGSAERKSVGTEASEGDMLCDDSAGRGGGVGDTERGSFAISRNMYDDEKVAARSTLYSMGGSDFSMPGFALPDRKGEGLGAIDGDGESTTANETIASREIHSSGDSKDSRNGVHCREDVEGMSACDKRRCLLFDFELRLAYPSRTLSNDLTLKDAGLVPNGTIHVRKLSS